MPTGQRISVPTTPTRRPFVTAPRHRVFTSLPDRDARCQGRPDDDPGLAAAGFGLAVLRLVAASAWAVLATLITQVREIAIITSRPTSGETAAVPFRDCSDKLGEIGRAIERFRVAETFALQHAFGATFARPAPPYELATATLISAETGRATPLIPRAGAPLTMVTSLTRPVLEIVAGNVLPAASDASMLSL